MPKFKAVIDTNIMVSIAFAKECSAGEPRDMIAEEAITLATSKEILADVYILHISLTARIPPGF